MTLLTDENLNRLLRQLLVKKTAFIVRSLLRGNDTQCFTTEQYEQEWIRKYSHEIGSVKLARMHLELPAIRKMVKEVSPNVWSAIYLQHSEGGNPCEESS